MTFTAGATAVGEAQQRLFPYERWHERLPALAAQYRDNLPFPHMRLTDFLEDGVIRRAAEEFPATGDATWIQYKHYNENKLGKTDRATFPPMIGKVIDELNSPEFVAWLSRLTGIDGLMADPSLEGGGMHQTEAGGFLNMHTDFTHHHHRPGWRRRCNLILYLNDGWRDEWGGAIEFWDRDVKQCVAKYQPLLNNAVIFNTTDISYHGYPDPIAPPQDVTRKSLALYYYTLEADPPSAPRSTNYRARPGDGVRAVWIWLDKKALAVYSALKRKLGLSDAFVSKVLGWLSRKKK
jgi:hypothetical protein